MTTIIVIAKEPLPGRAKTRLTPPFTAEQAAAVAAAAITDTLDCVDRTPATARILSFAGDPAGWARPGWRVVGQPASGGLDLRLVAAFGHATGPTVLIGMDTPQVQPGQLTAFDPQRHDACLGLAADGGFWAIGFADPSAAACILGVPMSTARTGAAQRRRMIDLGLDVQLLDELIDVDDVDTAAAVARSAPGTAFAAAVADALNEDVA